MPVTRPLRGYAIVVLALAFVLSALHAAGFDDVPIKDTAYPVPPDAWFVATTGSDANPGTEPAPFRTIGHAVDVAPSGATIVIRGGVYREPGSTFARPLTLQPYPHERVWLKGSVVITDWTADGNRWRKDGWTVEFDPDTYPEGALEPGFPYAGMPDMVFADGDPLVQVGSLEELGEGMFYVDTGADRLYIGVDPRGRTIEAAAYERALRAVTPAAAGTVVRGLGFMHFAGDRFGGTLQCDNAFTVFENNTVAWAAGKGLAIYQTAAVVRGNTLIYNGQMGLAAWRADGLLVEQNRLAANNQEHFVQGGAVAEAAGAKITDSAGLVVRDNIFEDNLATGLWLDVSIHDARVVRNIARNNARNGLYFEISSNAILASNVVLGNDSGIVVSNAADVQVYNNTLVDNVEQLAVVDDSRVNTDPDELALGITYVTGNVVVKNNILSGGRGTPDALLYARDFNSAPLKDADEMIVASDFNAYHRPDSSLPADLVEWWRGTSRLVFGDLGEYRQATGHEASGVAVDDAAADPFFVDAPAGDYRLQAGSIAVGAGDALPPSVADAVGVLAAGSPNLGAFVGSFAADPPLSVPDGTSGTQALRADRIGLDGTRIRVDWDDRCAPFNVKLIFGPLSTVMSYQVSGAECSIPGSFGWEAVPDGDLWFLAVGDNAFGVEGAWGRGATDERNVLLPSRTCGATVKDPGGVCR